MVDCSSFIGLIYSHCVSLVKMKPAGHILYIFCSPSLISHHSTGILEPNTPSLVSSNYAHISFFSVFFCWCAVASHHCLPSYFPISRKKKCCRYEQRFKNCFSIQLTKSFSCPLLTHQTTEPVYSYPCRGQASTQNHLSTGSPLRERSPCSCRSLVLNQRGGELRFSFQTC